MRKPLTEAEKQYLYKRKQAGETLREIATTLGCAYETARKWWRHYRDGTHPCPRGRPAEGALSTYPQDVRERAVALKQAHPHWGPDKVRVELQAALELSPTEVPSASRLAVLFREACPETVKRYRKRQYPERVPSTARSPHDQWQLDAKEKVAVGSDDVATVLTARDQYSALMVTSRAYVTTTEKGWRKLTLVEVQETLRYAFQQWGLPRTIQTDREVVYIGAPERYFPSLFTLWLIGLGIAHELSRTRRPTDQAEIERTHRTLGDWVWNDVAFATVADLQATLDMTRDSYNAAYPARTAHCEGQPPLSGHPHAAHSGRPFQAGAEWEMFDQDRVDAYLAQQTWTRLANATGTVSVASQPYYLGRAYAGETIAVTFRPESRCFCFETERGDHITDEPAIGLDKADIIGRSPVEVAWPQLVQPFQLPLPLQGV